MRNHLWGRSQATWLYSPSDWTASEQRPKAVNQTGNGLHLLGQKMETPHIHTLCVSTENHVGSMKYESAP